MKYKASKKILLKDITQHFVAVSLIYTFFDLKITELFTWL